jgi:hypothetical protein
LTFCARRSGSFSLLCFAIVGGCDEPVGQSESPVALQLKVVLVAVLSVRSGKDIGRETEEELRFDVDGGKIVNVAGRDVVD